MVVKKLKKKTTKTKVFSVADVDYVEKTTEHAKIAEDLILPNLLENLRDPNMDKIETMARLGKGYQLSNTKKDLIFNENKFMFFRFVLIPFLFKLKRLFLKIEGQFNIYPELRKILQRRVIPAF